MQEIGEHHKGFKSPISGLLFLPVPCPDFQWLYVEEMLYDLLRCTYWANNSKQQQFTKSAGRTTAPFPVVAILWLRLRDLFYWNINIPTILSMLENVGDLKIPSMF